MSNENLSNTEPTSSDIASHQSNTSADLSTGVGTHNVVTGEEAKTEAGANGLASGALIGGTIGTLAAWPIGAVVGGTLGSLVGGVAGDASEVALHDNINESPLADLTSGISADRDATLSDEAFSAQTGDSLKYDPSSTDSAGGDPITRQSFSKQVSGDEIV